MMRSSFVGSTVTRVVAREFWLNGELVTPCAVVYFSNLDRECWKLRYNDESLEWELSTTTDLPAAGTVEGDDDFRYPTVDLAATHELAGLQVAEFLASDFGHYAQASIRFSNGSMIVFRHWYQSDEESFFCESPNP